MKNSLDPTLPSSWIEIHPDNTVLIRTGKSDFGQGSTFTAYRQIVAEELSVPFEAITTVVSGDTDRTPDGSGAFDFLGHGTPNIRKAAAYTYQALLDLASEKLGVPKDKLSVKDGVVSGGGKSISYGDLVKNQQLKLTIPVKGDLTSIIGLTIEGNPPMKPVSEYTVIGKSFKNSIISSKVAAKETWATDVRLPGMLHARVVHPKTLGSTLVSAGQLDKTKFPNSQVIVKGNLVGVVAPTEWEAIQAAEQVAGATKWTEWKGLPGNAKLYEHLREESDWTISAGGEERRNQGRRGARARVGSQETFRHLPVVLHEARADWTDHGRCRCQGGRHGAHPYAQPESAGAARRDCDDAAHHARSCDRAFVSGTRPLRTIERRQCRRGRRGGDPVASRGQAGARAVDARGRYAVVHAIARCVLRCSDCARRKRQDRRVSNRPLHAGDAGRSAGRCGSRRTAHHGGAAGAIGLGHFHGQRHFGSVGLRTGSESCSSAAMAHSRWDRRLRRLPSVCAITACARRDSSSRTIRANWRSARQQRWRARTPSSFASTTRGKSGPSAC